MQVILQYYPGNADRIAYLHIPTAAEKPTIKTRQWWQCYRGGEQQDNTGLQVAAVYAEQTAADRQTTCVRRGQDLPPSLPPLE
jgi:hypothetical protein